MRVPGTISKNCVMAYEPEKNYARRWRSRKIRSFSIERWDGKIPKTLQELCVESIAENWTEYPILDEIILLEDKYFLLDILPEELPLELTIPKIKEDIYWKKCYMKRWPKKLPTINSEVGLNRIVRNGINEVNEAYLNKALGNRNTTYANNDHQSISGSKSSSRRTSRKQSIKTASSQQEQEGRTWKKYYCEMHVKDYLQDLKPENYNPEKIKELCDLCGSYIEILQIDEMISSENSSNKIPLNAIITGFPNLSELSLCFKQAYAEAEFSWNIVNTSYQDICLFAKGLDKIRLQKIRITNSDIDCDKVIVILKALLKHDDLQVLDFSHCKIGNRGMIAISKFILENTVREVYLANNRIGSKGISSLAYAVAQEACNLNILDIRLNQFFDDAANLLINSIIQYNTSINFINMSGCGLTENVQIADFLQSNCLQKLDISNNALGKEPGNTILQALKYNSTLKKINLGMCKVPSSMEADIQNEVYKNRKGIKKPIMNTKDKTDIMWDDNLISEMEDILLLERRPISSPTETTTTPN